MAVVEGEFTVAQRRALAVFTVVALLFGGYFLRDFFVLIVVAAVGAYLFTPLFRLLDRRLPTGLAATGALLAALAAVVIPVALGVFLAVVQVSRTVTHIAEWVEQTDVNTLGDRTLRFVNELLARVPFVHAELSMESLRRAMTTAGQRGGELLLHLLQGAAGGVVGVVTSAIIFVYVFLALLVHRDRLVTLIGQLNPLGEEVTELYLAKTGAMVRGTVGGQFVIALFQGVSGAASIYIGGFHQGFFIFAILLTALSIIPLGGGIVTMPFGIGMALFGNVAGGVFVFLFHLIVVTNIDNVLRPVLVPRDARLNPALMLLAVFAGIAMFGFWGIVIGPVLMILIVTTIDVYLAVYKGVELEQRPDDEPKSRRRQLAARKPKAALPAAKPSGAS